MIDIVLNYKYISKPLNCHENILLLDLMRCRTHVHTLNLLLPYASYLAFLDVCPAFLACYLLRLFVLSDCDFLLAKPKARQISRAFPLLIPCVPLADLSHHSSPRTTPCSSVLLVIFGLGKPPNFVLHDCLNVCVLFCLVQSPIRSDVWSCGV